MIKKWTTELPCRIIVSGVSLFQELFEIACTDVLVLGWRVRGMIFVALILKHFLACITGRLVLRETFHSHSVWLKEKCCCDGFLFGIWQEEMGGFDHSF